jgi:hypothetical protein
MDKVEKILEKYKIYLGMRDVAVEIRPYKTRTAFTKLSSPPIIHLNEYLIDETMPTLPLLKASRSRQPAFTTSSPAIPLTNRQD